jgi:hypothetical protein
MALRALTHLLIPPLTQIIVYLSSWIAEEAEAVESLERQTILAQYS